MLKELSIDTLDGLFNVLDQQDDIVFWIRNANYQRQIYVSPSFEHLHQMPRLQLYEYPESFNDYLISSNRNTVITTIDKMVKNEISDYDGIQMFQMIVPNNQPVGFKQTTFALVDSSGNHIGFAGIAKYLPDDLWHSEFEQWQAGLELTITTPVKNHIIHLLRDEAKTYAIPSKALATAKSLEAPSLLRISGHPVDIPLTQREQECLTHLIKGYSAKQTARLLNVSPRTVEFHLGNIKDKAKCRTNVELLGKFVRLNSL